VIHHGCWKDKLQTALRRVRLELNRYAVQNLTRTMSATVNADILAAQLEGRSGFNSPGVVMSGKL